MLLGSGRINTPYPCQIPLITPLPHDKPWSYCPTIVHPRFVTASLIECHCSDQVVYNLRTIIVSHHLADLQLMRFVAQQLRHGN